MRPWQESYHRSCFYGSVESFRCLPHSLQIAKLTCLWCWFVCLWRVKIGTTRSSWAELTKGVPQGSILRPLLFNIFINDPFHFIEKCTLYNYSDDNSISHSSSTLQTVLSNLLIDCRIAVEWFSNNGMKANPNKFQPKRRTTSYGLRSFSYLGSKLWNDIVNSEPGIANCDLSPNSADDIELKLDENTTLRSEKSVKALGVIIDNRLTFGDHISACCLKAARQLNALARISKYLDPKSKSIICNSFIRSNFEYCPLVWHFCGKTNNNKFEKIQERSLRILQDTYELSYEELLNRNGFSTLLLHRIKLLLLETYKSFHCMNANCLHNIFKFNCTSYERRSVKLIQPKRRTTSYRLRSFSYLG